jgi:calcineurin-like phosphoesterase family protein
MYLTSDLHVGHKKVAWYRGYGDDVDAHDRDIVEHWRATVQPDDHVWILGDLAMSSPDRALEILAELPGHKHLVAGNHDACHPMHRNAWKHQRRYLTVFDSVQSAARRKVGDREVLFSHFPYRGDHTAEDRHVQWRLPDQGAWLIHGHTHSEERRQYPRCIHVGWDAWRRLVSWQEIQRIIEETG